MGLIAVSFFADARTVSKLTNVLMIYFFHFLAVDIAYSLVSIAWRAPKCRMAQAAEYAAVFVGVLMAGIACSLVSFSLAELMISPTRLGIGLAAGAVIILVTNETIYRIFRFRGCRRGADFLWLSRHAFYFSLLIQSMLLPIPVIPIVP